MAVTGILGKKLGMTQVLTDDGRVIPVTVLKAGPCVVVQRKTKDSDGYEAVQLGLVEFIKPRRVNRPMTGHFKKSDVPPLRFLREIRLAEAVEAKAGDKVLVEEVFKKDDKVDVIGVSKGRGYAGAVKRHNFRGGAKTHGSMFHRAPGSIGASSYPSRLWPGQRMAGQMGNVRVTARSLRVVEVDSDEHLLLVRGTVPGATGSYVTICRAKAVSRRRK